jgi:hypothetical protein
MIAIYINKINFIFAINLIKEKRYYNKSLQKENEQ